MSRNTARLAAFSCTVLVVSLTMAQANDEYASSKNVQERAARLMADWVDQSGSVDFRASGCEECRHPLPAGTVLARTEVQDSVVGVYLDLPSEFLRSLSEDQCEAVIRESVSLLTQVESLRGFGVWARSVDEPDGEYLPLPSYLPRPRSVEKEVEGEPEAAGRLRSGGLPTYNPGRPAGALSGKTIFLSPGHGWYYSSVLGRWATQRGNTYGVIEDHSNGEAVLQHLARYLHNAGANVWTTRERDLNTNMVIVDNNDGSPTFTTTGSWPTGTSAGTWKGANYQYSAVSTTETAVATYVPNIPEAGYYSVSTWTPSASNRATDATVRVNHTGGTTTHTINMQRDGNTWRFLGVYYFNAGNDSTSGSVEISNKGADLSKYVVADAVRFGGGMGDYVDGGSVSGKPRWEESGAYYPVFMGKGTAAGGTVSSMPLYADWESESWEDSIYFSWHTNASTGSGHGTSVWVYGPGSPPSPFGEFSGIAGSDSLATRIRDEVVNDLRIAWNDASWPGYLYSAWFGELNPSYNDEMPSCLIEVAYHDSATDANSILDPRFRDMVSRAVYQAIVKWWRYDADGPNTTAITHATLLPEPPTHLAVRNTGGGEVRVSWHAPQYNNGNNLLGDAAVGYLVQRSEDGFGFSDGEPTTNLYMDFTDLTPGRTYYFRVVAVNTGGYSFASEIGAVRVSVSASPILVVNGFDRLDKSAMLSEDDPYDTDPMLRERMERMNNYAYSRTFAAAIEPTGVAFDYCANEAVRDSDVGLGGYDAVIWQCGEESTVDDTFDSTEQTRMMNYLASGGNLFVSGAEIGWDLDYAGSGASFYNNYLKADFSADDAGTFVAAPVVGSIFDGLGAVTFDDGSQVYAVDYPDVINTYGGSAAVLSYSGGTGGTAGVLYDGVWRLVHLAFPFETIIDSGQRIGIMVAVLDFFGLDPNQPPLPPADIIIESRDAAGALTSAPTYAESGSWANSSVKSAAAGLSGTGSRFITYDVPNSGTDNATFVPDVEIAGKYEVFVTWANGANCYDAQYTINHNHGGSVQLVDQISSGAPEPSNYDQWISLGQYWFQAGQNASSCSINVSEETVSGKPAAGWNQRVYSDGLKLSFVKWWPSGDADGDGDTDLVDFSGFGDCLLGPDTAYSDPDCEAYDFDLDGDVDLRDFDSFQRAYITE